MGKIRLAWRFESLLAGRSAIDEMGSWSENFVFPSNLFGYQPSRTLVRLVDKGEKKAGGDFRTGALIHASVTSLQTKPRTRTRWPSMLDHSPCFWATGVVGSVLVLNHGCDGYEMKKQTKRLITSFNWVFLSPEAPFVCHAVRGIVSLKEICARPLIFC